MADLSRINAKHLADFDREIQEFRLWYDAASPAEREEISRWLAELTAVAERNPARQRFTLHCRVNNLETNSEGDVVYNGAVYLTPKPMLAAITAWEAGEEFVPSHWMELE